MRGTLRDLLGSELTKATDLTEPDRQLIHRTFLRYFEAEAAYAAGQISNEDMAVTRAAVENLRAGLNERAASMVWRVLSGLAMSWVTGL